MTVRTAVAARATVVPAEIDHDGEDPSVPSRVARTATAAPPRAALSLLAQAQRGLIEAEYREHATDRFVDAYLAALRGAAAVLATHARPRNRRGPTSVWTLLSLVAPQLAEWAAFFAAESATRNAAEAGIPGCVTTRAADDLIRQAGQFLGLVNRTVHGSPR